MDKDNQEAIDWLTNNCQKVLTTWELDFLDSIDGRSFLTPKQQAKLDQIWEDVVAKRNRS